MSAPNITLLVANPSAAGGSAAAVLSKAMAALEDRGLCPELATTSVHVGPPTRLLNRLRRGDVARVAYLGGDGTFAEAAKAILGAKEQAGIDVPLGLLPMGTANNQGRSFGVRAGAAALRRNVDILAAGHERVIDAGEIQVLGDDLAVLGQDLFFDNFSMGLSAKILRVRNRSLEAVHGRPILRQLWRGHVAYIGASAHRYFGTLAQGWSFGVDAICDGTPISTPRCTDFIVNNTALYAGEWVFDRAAAPDDGRFEYVPLTSHAAWIQALAVHHKRLTLLDPLAPRYPSASEIELRVRDGASIPSQIDGEQWLDVRHVRIGVRPSALRVIIPEGGSIV